MADECARGQRGNAGSLQTGLTHQGHGAQGRCVGRVAGVLPHAAAAGAGARRPLSPLLRARFAHARAGLARRRAAAAGAQAMGGGTGAGPAAGAGAACAVLVATRVSADAARAPAFGGCGARAGGAAALCGWSCWFPRRGPCPGSVLRHLCYCFQSVMAMCAGSPALSRLSECSEALSPRPYEAARMLCTSIGQIGLSTQEHGL